MIRRAAYIALALYCAIFLGCASTADRFRPPRVASKQALDYPLSAQLDKIEGEVVVGVFVDAEGFPEEVKIMESSGYAVLDTAAFRFAHTLTFDPAVVDDREISSWTKLLLRYKLTEIPFEKNKWLEDVRHYQNKIETAPDSVEKNLYQQKLYMRYFGLITYVERYNDVEINDIVKRVVDQHSWNRWAAFSDVMAAPFVVYDDFLYRYPESALTKNVTEDLIRLLIEAEGDLRIQALNAKLSPKHVQLLESIKKRLDDLQREDLNKMMQAYPLR